MGMLVSPVAGKIRSPFTVNPPAQYANQIWGMDFKGDVAIGIAADVDTWDGINFTQPITGSDSSGYNFSSSLATALNCSSPVVDIDYILTNGGAPALADLYTKAQPVIQPTDGPNGALVNGFKPKILSRALDPGLGASPQMHLQIKRGNQETVQPPELAPMYFEQYIRLPADVRTNLSVDSNGNWLSLWEIKKAFQYYRPINKYYYGFGSYRVSIQVIYSGGQLLFRVQGDSLANPQTAIFTAGISGNTMTVSAISQHSILPGMTVTSGGTGKVLSGPATGGTGDYILSGAPQSVAPGTAMQATVPSATYWYFNTAGVDLDTWLFLQVYLEPPSSRAAVDEGITWVRITPEGGSALQLCDHRGQAAGKYQIGDVEDEVYGRLYGQGIAYSGGLCPYGIEVANIRWFDGYPYAPSLPPQS